ncbi:cupredoxin domain-containing protein [uncultured Psychroserpens sp.]|uniref:cupredoxin domain-containing protein n=1 Tax=uncultured Psychroserpens sp. TaxID=255436 RepID=UPI00262C4443|nr:cupredoxin domain-containing protein [uncultured Psychroserpens sp.]
MKNLFVGLFLVAFTLTTTAQDKMMKTEVKTVSLEQTKGEFTQKAITLSEGTYVFEISNNAVGHDVGFVLAPKGKTDAANHIKAAYVTKVVATGNTESSNEVTLDKGEYVYFCPMNPTPEYTLIVK